MSLLRRLTPHPGQLNGGAAVHDDVESGGMRPGGCLLVDHV
jgi:hypothetical protein